MRICLILEGCYPYVRGGVSAWAHQYISGSAEHEFVLWTIHAARSDTAEACYELPPNVAEHHTLILQDVFEAEGRTAARPEAVIAALDALLRRQPGALEALMQAAAGLNGSTCSVARSEAFVHFAEAVADRTPGFGVADAYHGLRSMLLPLIHLLRAEVPRADLYHAAVTGYGGLLGALARSRTGRPFVLTEHGIYPREREEELLMADWLCPALRDLWIDLFYDLSRFAYAGADRVTALFPGASERQALIGCPPEKCRVIPNGIDLAPFLAIPPAEAGLPLHIGALIRFAPIKDLKTMLRAFAAVHHRHPDAVLHLMGGTDDEAYRASCVRLVKDLGLQDAVRLEGHIAAAERLPQMRFTVLSSISEGQPLAVLESMAAARPVVSTRVGNCPELLLGDPPCGLIVPPMRPDLLAEAMLALCEPDAPIRRMGLAGRERVTRHHRLDDMLQSYHQLYREVLPLGRNRI